MNANILASKIIEKNLPINEALEIVSMICGQKSMTIADVIWIKNVLMLTNLEAIEIFLS